MHQIKEVQSSGYDDREIIDSANRAMVPRSGVRGVLKATHGILLAKLLYFLETDCNKKSTEDLCRTMTTALLQLLDEFKY